MTMWKAPDHVPGRVLGPHWLCLLLLATGTLRVFAQEELGAAPSALRREQRQGRGWRGENKFYFNDDSNEYDEYGGGWVMGNAGRQRRPGQNAWVWSREPSHAERPRANGEAAGSGGCGITTSSRVINGKEALRGEFPWQAALVYQLNGQRRTYCGGALIHPRFVLTAAHCLDPRVIEGQRLVEVRLGLVEQGKVDAQARSVAIEKQLPHPAYHLGYSLQRVRNENDIALLRLAQPAPYTDFIRPVCLPNPQGNRLLSQKGISSPLVVAGWGITEAGMYSDKLMFAPVPKVEAPLCGQRLTITVPDSQLCAGGNVTDTCNGDSGGPLVQANDNGRGDMVFELVGLVSFGPRNCGTVGLPAGYTRVAAFRAWIEQILRQEGFKIA